MDLFCRKTSDLDLGDFKEIMSLSIALCSLTHVAYPLENVKRNLKIFSELGVFLSNAKKASDFLPYFNYRHQCFIDNGTIPVTMLRHGPVFRYNKEKIIGVGEYVDGQLVKMDEYFDFDKQLIKSSKRYAGGKLHGTVHQYWISKDGLRLRYKGEFVHGKPVGRHDHYYPDNRIIVYQYDNQGNLFATEQDLDMTMTPHRIHFHHNNIEFATPFIPFI